jgi:hypothetical protein
MALNTHPHLGPRLKKESKYISAAPMVLHGLFLGELLPFKYYYIFLFIAVSTGMVIYR